VRALFSGLKESLKQKLVKVLEENLVLSEKIQQLEGTAATSIVSGHPSHTHGKLGKPGAKLPQRTVGK
jgi:leucine-rich repeat-containing protein 36